MRGELIHTATCYDEDTFRQVVAALLRDAGDEDGPPYDADRPFEATWHGLTGEIAVDAEQAAYLRGLHIQDTDGNEIWIE